MWSSWTAIGATVATALLGGSVAPPAFQAPAVRSVDEKVLREYAGVYRWAPNAFAYLQMWNELTGTNQLVAFDESGEVRTLYPTDRDRFFTGPGAAVPTSIEARVEFQRDAAGKITSLTWKREGTPSRIARRVEIETLEAVRFANGAVELAGTLIRPNVAGKHPAVILVHGSGQESVTTCCLLLGSSCAGAWQSSRTTSVAWAARRAIGTRPPSTIWRVTWWRRSAI